mmetsp:Transcript_86095/g.200193  ORF Transcript_86095/g.200193 Transcript_86095/m.200193 type:complete len:120 (-) Transcript_86095:17-376(-)
MGNASFAPLGRFLFNRSVFSGSPSRAAAVGVLGTSGSSGDVIPHAVAAPAPLRRDGTDLELQPPIAEEQFRREVKLPVCGRGDSCLSQNGYGQVDEAGSLGHVLPPSARGGGLLLEMDG